MVSISMGTSTGSVNWLSVYLSARREARDNARASLGQRFYVSTQDLFHVTRFILKILGRFVWHENYCSGSLQILIREHWVYNIICNAFYYFESLSIIRVSSMLVIAHHPNLGIEKYCIEQHNTENLLRLAGQHRSFKIYTMVLYMVLIVTVFTI